MYVSFKSSFEVFAFFIIIIQVIYGPTFFKTHNYSIMMSKGKCKLYKEHLPRTLKVPRYFILLRTLAHSTISGRSVCHSVRRDLDYIVTKFRLNNFFEKLLLTSRQEIGMHTFHIIIRPVSTLKEIDVIAGAIAKEFSLFFSLSGCYGIKADFFANACLILTNCMARPTT